MNTEKQENTTRRFSTNTTQDSTDSLASIPSDAEEAENARHQVHDIIPEEESADPTYQLDPLVTSTSKNLGSKSIEGDGNESNNLSTITRQLTRTITTLPPLADDDPFYDKFSPLQKSIFVGIVSYTCFLSPISNLAFVPAIPELAKTLHSTPQIINASNAVFNIGMAFSPILLGPLASIYGKRIMMIWCAIGYTLFTALSGASNNLPMFFIFRVLTALAGTSCFSIGGSIIGDIKRPKERGKAMGWVLLGTQLGPCIGPVLGGLIVTYTNWRVIFWVMTGFGAIDIFLVTFVLKETSRIVLADELKKRNGKKFVFVKYNPFRVFGAFRYMNLIFAGMVSSSLIYNMYGLLTPIRQIINPRFHLTTPIYGALFYLAPGTGYVLGSVLGGKYADHTVKKWIKKRNGERVPEDRLKSTYIAHGLVQPICMLIYGWALEKRKGGKAVPIIAMFVCAFGQTITFPSLNAYCVDCLPSLKGDAISSNYFARYFFGGALASGTCLIQVDNIGVGWFSTISAFVLWFGFLGNLLLITFGAKLRQEALDDFEKRKSQNKGEA